MMNTGVVYMGFALSACRLGCQLVADFAAGRRPCMQGSIESWPLSLVPVGSRLVREDLY